MIVGKLNPQGKVNFPGFQEILDFTATGSETSVSVAVDGNVDKEYVILTNNKSTNASITLRLNNDATANKYGRQYLHNYAGTVSSARDTSSHFYLADNPGFAIATLLTPTGLLKTLFKHCCIHNSGTTVQGLFLQGQSFNSTSNIISLDFGVEAGLAFIAESRVIVYARRSNI